MDTSMIGLSENQLKRQGLECLVMVLRSLVSWGTTAGKSAIEAVVDTARTSSVGDDPRQIMSTPDQSSDRLSTLPVSSDALRQPTPETGDDPTKFESAKQKKTTLLEGVKKFNFKPARASSFPHKAVALVLIQSRESDSSSKLASFRQKLPRT
jgi:brefeldin A-inhibited guanine nucleotide-exchange protein